MKIAILGGSFNPPHLGHLLVAQQIKERLGMDEVWLMPCASHPFGKKMAPSHHRLHMVKRMEEDGIKASDFEIKKDKTSYTVDTLNQLTLNFPKNKFYWIIGSEQLVTFDKWKNPEELIRKHNLIIFPRDIRNKDLAVFIKKRLNLSKLPENIVPIDLEEIVTTNVSSTLIRHRIKNKQPVTSLVPKKVEKYIIKNRLYV